MSASKTFDILLNKILSHFHKAETDLTFTDITTNNSSVDKHGFMPKLSNVAGEFLNGLGQWAATGLTNWTESVTLYSSKYYTRLAVTSAQANVDAVISPKGQGGFSLQQADGTAAGGNARGLYAIDLSLVRDSASQVANGDFAFNAGYGGTASGDYSWNTGKNGTVAGTHSWNCGVSGRAVTIYAVNTGAFGYAAMVGENTHASGGFIQVGDAQRRELVLRALTTNTTPKVLTADADPPGTLNQLIVYNNQSVTAQVLVVAKKTGTTTSAHFILKVAATRGTSAATTIVHSVTTETLPNPDNVVITATADTTLGSVTLTVTTPGGNWYTVADVFAISVINA